jgi:hypothetical protein
MPRYRKNTDTLIALVRENQFLGQLQFFLLVHMALDES